MLRGTDRFVCVGALAAVSSRFDLVGHRLHGQVAVGGQEKTAGRCRVAGIFRREWSGRCGGIGLTGSGRRCWHFGEPDLERFLQLFRHEYHVRLGLVVSGWSKFSHKLIGKEKFEKSKFFII